VRPKLLLVGGTLLGLVQYAQPRQRRRSSTILELPIYSASDLFWKQRDFDKTAEGVR